MKWILLVLVVFAGVNYCALSFEAEELDFTLHLDNLMLDGLYHFANYADSSISRVIMFPVPVDSLCLEPELLSLAVVNDSLSTCQLLGKGKQGFSFMLTMPERSFCTLRISYKQQLRGNYARYIITTANGWGKPLPYAKYSLTVADEVKLLELPFPAPQRSEGHYYWEFSDFSPTREFELKFGSW